jgi:glycosyltransferase involved in cell wall biosynthesis
VTRDNKICFVAAVPLTVRAFLRDQLRALGERYRLSVALNSNDAALLTDLGINGTLNRIPIERPLRPFADLRALVALICLMRRERFDLIHSITPKAGLLAMAAGFLARCPIRIHTFTGQVWATRGGVARGVLRLADKALAALATHVLADSASQRDFLIREGVVRAEKIAVLANGSICGVDAARFAPNPIARRDVRAELGIPADAVVFFFLGRLTLDKGVLDLASAFREVAATRLDAWLLVVGPDEGGMLEQMRGACGPAVSRLRAVDYSLTPERFMAAADVYCLPSYREGFGTSVIEAAACGVPAIASRIYGVVDAVVEGETGVLHPPRDVAALAALMATLAGDRVLRERLGAAARERALRDFPAERVTQALLALYERLLQARGESAR